MNTGPMNRIDEFNARSRWIRFELIAAKPKTSVWSVVAREGGERLGVVAWYAPWRTYAFEPEPTTVFERRCLKDIVCFLEVQNEDHKRTRAAAKAAARGIE